MSKSVDTEVVDCKCTPHNSVSDTITRVTLNTINYTPYVVGKFGTLLPKSYLLLLGKTWNFVGFRLMEK